MSEDASSALDPARVPPPVLEILRKLEEAGHEAWVVGGAVRDLLRGSVREAADWDVATSARPEVVQRLFRRVIPTGIRHGTVTVLGRAGPVEVTTFRGEGTYSDARRPDQVEFLDRIEDDLARRDFTVNAIAWDPLTGRVVDPFGGQTDLRRGVLRAVGDARERFAEDGLRPLRAVRFACVLEMELDPDTEAAIPERLDRFRRVAAERVTQELHKLLGAEGPGRGLLLLGRTGLLGEIAPELQADAGRAALLDATPPVLALRLAALLWGVAPGAAQALLDRLRHPHALRDRVVRLLGAPAPADALAGGEAGLRRALSQVGPGEGGDLAELWAALEASGAGAPPGAAARLRAVLAARPPVRTADLRMSGREVMDRLGVPPGPEVGRVLAWLLDAVLERPELNTPEALGRLLDQWPGPR